ncbi:MAG: hypothetical protein QM820_04565 [Minicystis sp.]
MPTLETIRDLLEMTNSDLVRWLDVDEAKLAQADAAPPLDRSFEQRLLPVGRAHAELVCLRDLIHLADERTRNLRGRDLRNVTINPVTFPRLHDHAPETLRMLHELRTRAFGKAVLVRDVHTGERRVFRIAQANVGFPEIGVLNRLAPLARRLVSASVGDEVATPKAQYKVIGVAHFQRFFGSELSIHENDFQRMDLEHERLEAAAVVEGLARSVSAFREDFRKLLFENGTVELDLGGEYEVRDVQFGEAERLSAQFYTRTTTLQEELMRRPSYGVVVVIGVAGSGKTSVALGRTKVLCDRTEEEEDEDQRLAAVATVTPGGEPPAVEAPTAKFVSSSHERSGFFRTESAIGFVLNEQLKTYLERACIMLALYDMKVREYRDLREDLLRTRNLDAAGLERAVGAEAHPLETTMRWLRALDVAIAERFADALDDALSRVPAERESVRKQVAMRNDAQNRALEELWSVLRGRMGEVVAWLRKDDRVPGVLRLEGLAARIDEVRARFDHGLDAHPAWSAAAHRELRQNVHNTLRERIVRALRLTDAYVAALGAPKLVREFERNGVGASEAAAAIASAKVPIRDGRLTDTAIDVLLALAHAVSLGYAGRGDKNPILHLVQPEFYTQVFIDEYQDFTEVQLYLMGAQADPRRRAVTIVGDPRQQLRSVRELDIRACFPRASKQELAPTVLLENKRQTGALGRFSQHFREAVLKDAAGEPPMFAKGGVLPRLVRAAPDAIHDAIENEIMRLPRNCSVAVICATADIAKRLERELRDRLTGQFRETRYSTHTELLRRFFVHFTTALDAKGLEFDAAIVPCIDHLDLSDPIVANSLYVAISRPRQYLAIIAPHEAREVLACLIPEGMAELVDSVVPDH